MNNKHSKLMLLLALVGYTFLYSPRLFASHFRTALEPRMMRFHYAEYSDEHSKLAQEQGNIFGIYVELQHAISSSVNLGVFGQHLNGTVDYIGATQIGAAHTTTTQQKITNFGIVFSYHFYNNTKVALQYSDYQWQRAIQPTANVKGLKENYYWRELQVGTSYTFHFSGLQTLELEAGIISILSPKIEIMLANDSTPSVWLSLGENLGGSCQLTYRKKLFQQLQFNANLQYRQFSFGKSNTQTVTNNGRVYAIYEPKSISQYTVAGLGLTYDF